MNKPAVLVIGDVMLDVRVDGEMTRVSPEAPAPIISDQSQTDTLGGAGNVARNVVALGHPAYLAACIGEDAAGNKLRQLAAENGVHAFYAVARGGYPTTEKRRITCDGQILLRVDREWDATRLWEDMTHALCAGIQQLDWAGGAIGAVVIADYGKGVVTPALMDYVREACRLFSVPIFVDPYPPHADIYRGVDLLKPNFEEAMKMLQHDPHPGLAVSNDAKDRMECACTLLANLLGVGTVAVTGGSVGCCYSTLPDHQDTAHIAPWGPAGIDIVRDICGAGDTVIAAMAVGYLEQMSLEARVKFAMQAAGYVVQFYGVHVADRDAVDDFVYQHGDYTRKLMTIDQAVQFAVRRRKADPNVTVALANGCFDGFHAAHLEIFRFAKQQADILLVAYNDDASLRALKGDGRPHVPLEHRATHLAMQDPVDAVFPFDGNTESMIWYVRPDVLVKGGDTPDPVVGADIVEGYGGRVLKAYTDFRVVVSRETEFVPGADI